MTAEWTNRRTVITGVGVVSPIGIGNDSFWRSLMAGKTGIGYFRSVPCESLPSKLAAELTATAPDSDNVRALADFIAASTRGLARG